MVTISVLIITYNQENVIGRALESVLQQKEWGLKEIVVCDDNSTDNNWEVIQQYYQKFPQYIRAYRNVQNLGIYNNLEKLYSLKGNADAFVVLAGDDKIYNGLFEKIQECIETYEINVETDAALICMDYSVIRPTGKTIILRPNKVLTKYRDSKRLKIRDFVYLRGAVITKRLMDRYENIAEGKSVTLAEWLCEFQPFQKADKIFYCPFVANAYYSQKGVSTTMKDKNHFRLSKEKWGYIYNNFPMCKKDKNYVLLRKFISIYAFHPSFSSFLKIIKYFLLSRDFSLPFNKLSYYFSLRTIMKSTFLLN